MPLLLSLVADLIARSANTFAVSLAEAAIGSEQGDSAPLGPVTRRQSSGNRGGCRVPVTACGTWRDMR